MISFVWTPSSFWEKPLPIIPGNGGTETFTLGQARELTRRGIDCQIITFRLGQDDGRAFSPDIKFIDYDTTDDLDTLNGDVFLITEPLEVATTQPAYMMLHNPPYLTFTKQFYKKSFTGRKLVTNSKASARLWADYLQIPEEHIGVMYPFADAVFGSQVAGKRSSGPTRVLFAGRLTPHKGFYTFLEAIHAFADDKNIEFTVVLAGDQDPEYTIVEPLAHAHPLLKTVSAQRSPQDMAKLLTDYDILVMPSHSVLWKEPFGMLSVEAQHAGCRVVASDIGGLPETDCGGLHLFEADNPVALAETIKKAASLGRLTDEQRKKTAACFTVEQSVDQMLEILAATMPVYQP